MRLVIVATMFGSALHLIGLGMILAVPVVAAFSLLGIPKVARGHQSTRLIVGPAAVAFGQLILGGGLVLLGIPFEYGVEGDVLLFVPGAMITTVGLLVVASALRFMRQRPSFERGHRGEICDRTDR